MQRKNQPWRAFHSQVVTLEWLYWNLEYIWRFLNIAYEIIISLDHDNALTRSRMRENFQFRPENKYFRWWFSQFWILNDHFSVLIIFRVCISAVCVVWLLRTVENREKKSFRLKLKVLRESENEVNMCNDRYVATFCS